MQEGAVVDALGDVVAGSRTMKNLAEEPLDGGASTHQWSLSLIRSHLALAAARKREEGVERMNARVSGDGAGTGFDLPRSTRNRPMGMDGR
jgi:hypothetical protein